MMVNLPVCASCFIFNIEINIYMLTHTLSKKTNKRSQKVVKDYNVKLLKCEIINNYNNNLE